MVGRVADTIGGGERGGYFASDEERETFHAELKAILVNQYASFNSPAWFNVGFEETPQCSACFILSIDDSMESILDWIRREDHLPRRLGLGAQPLPAAVVQGAAQGRLRVGARVVHARRGRVGGDDQVGRQDAARREDGRARRRPSRRGRVHLVQGPRRAQGARAQAGGLRHVARLGRLGVDPVPEREQLVRVTDAFMEAVSEGKEWALTARTDGTVVETVDALGCSVTWPRPHGNALTRASSTTRRSAWHLAQYGPYLNASNPCSEYMHIDDSACNLASLELHEVPPRGRRVRRRDVRARRRRRLPRTRSSSATSSYPTPEIGRNAKRFRQLGLGYANLGALLMARGLPYDSDEGRAYAAAITALMTGRAYRKSAEVAKRMGPQCRLPGEPCRDGGRDREAPRGAVGNIDHTESVPDDLLTGARHSWDEALEIGEVHGFATRRPRCSRPPGRSAS